MKGHELLGFSHQKPQACEVKLRRSAYFEFYGPESSHAWPMGVLGVSVLYRLS